MPLISAAPMVYGAPEMGKCPIWHINCLKKPPWVDTHGVVPGSATWRLVAELQWLVCNHEALTAVLPHGYPNPPTWGRDVHQGTHKCRSGQSPRLAAMYTPPSPQLVPVPNRRWGWQNHGVCVPILSIKDQQSMVTPHCASGCHLLGNSTHSCEAHR